MKSLVDLNNFNLRDYFTKGLIVLQYEIGPESAKALLSIKLYYEIDLKLKLFFNNYRVS